jgi:hypothetical protein
MSTIVPSEVICLTMIPSKSIKYTLLILFYLTNSYVVLVDNEVEPACTVINLSPTRTIKLPLAALLLNILAVGYDAITVASRASGSSLEDSGHPVNDNAAQTNSTTFNDFIKLASPVSSVGDACGTLRPNLRGFVILGRCGRCVLAINRMRKVFGSGHRGERFNVKNLRSTPRIVTSDYDFNLLFLFLLFLLRFLLLHCFLLQFL